MMRALSGAKVLASWFEQVLLGASLCSCMCILSSLRNLKLAFSPAGSNM